MEVLSAVGTPASQRTTSLTAVNPRSPTLTRVATIASHKHWWSHRWRWWNSIWRSRYGTVNAGGAGSTGLVHIYI
jgi:hypothetical protein